MNSNTVTGYARSGVAPAGNNMTRSSGSRYPDGHATAPNISASRTASVPPAVAYRPGAHPAVIPNGFAPLANFAGAILAGPGAAATRGGPGPTKPGAAAVKVPFANQQMVNASPMMGGGGGSTAGADGMMNGPMGMGLGSMGSGWMPDVKNSMEYGSMNQVGSIMGSQYGLGSMRSQYDSMNGSGGPPMGMMYGMVPKMGPMGSIYGMNSMMGLLYGMGGQMGSLYGMGGQMGSLYGMGGQMGSMYGMGGQMGSMYGMGGQMGSLYGMGGQMGSLYGMGGQMGSTYGTALGMYDAVGYRSVVDAASRRDSFLGCNELIRADVKSFKSKAGNISEGEKIKEKATKEKKDRSVPAKPNTNVAKSTAAGSRRYEDTLKKSDAKKDDPADVATQERAMNAETPTETDAGDVKQTDAPPRPAAAGAPATGGVKPNDSEKAPLPKGRSIRGMITIVSAKDCRTKSITRKSATSVECDGAVSVVEEVVMKEGDRYEESVTTHEARVSWMAGHNTSLLLGCGKGQREATVSIMKGFLATVTRKLTAAGHFFDIHTTIAAIKDRNECKDLLKCDADYDKLVCGSSPVYGPAIMNLESKSLKSEEDIETVVNQAMKAATNPREMVCANFVLKQVKKTNNDSIVYLSSLNITIVGESVEHFMALKNKVATAPVQQYRYTVGGGSLTLVIMVIAENDKDGAKQCLAVMKAMREVSNSEPHSGNVKRFLDYTRVEILKFKERLAKSEGAHMSGIEKIIKRMEAMLADAKKIQAEPTTTIPIAYV